MLSDHRGPSSVPYSPTVQRSSTKTRIRFISPASTKALLRARVLPDARCRTTPHSKKASSHRPAARAAPTRLPYTYTHSPPIHPLSTPEQDRTGQDRRGMHLPPPPINPPPGLSDRARNEQANPPPPPPNSAGPPPPSIKSRAGQGKRDREREEGKRRGDENGKREIAARPEAACALQPLQFASPLIYLSFFRFLPSFSLSPLSLPP